MKILIIDVPKKKFSGEELHTQSLDKTLYDTYNVGYLPEVNILGTHKPALILYDTNTGEYSRGSTGDILTPINVSISNNPSDWTYLDLNGNTFTPNRNYNSGTITQGRERNNLDNLLTFSNQHYNDPILGAPARFANDWHNDRSPIKASLNYFDPTGLIGYGIDKGIDLYNEGTDALGVEDAVVAGLTALPFVNSKEANLLVRGTKDAWKLKAFPGYMIKSLSADSLGKQVSKQGTISLKNVEAWANKPDIPTVDKELLGRVLEAHKGEKTIDYNTLRKEVQELIPLYNRVPLTKYADYGLERLGFTTKLQEDPFYIIARNNKEKLNELGYDYNNYLGKFTKDGKFIQSIDINESGLYSDLYNLLTSIQKKNSPRLNTFTFESPGIVGNTKHYGGNPIGHSRTYTTADEPDVLHVMESLSDWALLAYKGDLKHSPVESRMIDTYTQRQIQENLKYAAENSLTRMRYPTPETAAKIEGYHQLERSSINELFDEQMSEYNKGRELLAELFFDKYINRLKKYKYDDVADVAQRGRLRFIEYEELPQDVVEEFELRGFFDKINNDKSFNIDGLEDEFSAKKRKYELEHPYPNLYIYTKDYSPEHKTILKKYADFPKQYQKLFGKKTNVRTVTDAKGNTWYEVDVPLDYLDGTAEMQFAFGGNLFINNNNSLGGNINRYNLGGNLFLTGGDNYIEHLNRNKVYNNYEDAVDNNMTPFMTGIRKGLRYLKDNINDSIPAGISNCTLTATQWVDPSNPIMSAKTIVSNPNSVGYSPITAEEALPGDLLIAKTPNKDSYHTMYISGFDSNGNPLLDYSKGGMNTDKNLRTNIPLDWYIANSDGHTLNLYFRNNKFAKSILPEVVVTGKKKSDGGGLFNYYNNDYYNDNIYEKQKRVSNGINSVINLFPSPIQPPNVEFDYNYKDVGRYNDKNKTIYINPNLIEKDGYYQNFNIGPEIIGAHETGHYYNDILKNKPLTNARKQGFLERRKPAKIKDFTEIPYSYEYSNNSISDYIYNHDGSRFEGVADLISKKAYPNEYQRYDDMYGDFLKIDINDYTPYKNGGNLFLTKPTNINNLFLN